MILTVRWGLAALHLLGLGIGLGAVWARRRALRGPVDAAGVRQALYADTWWGIAALIWVSTGLVRAFTGIEKGSDYYLHNHWFLTKMVLFLGVLALEIVPMVTLIRWRRALAAGGSPETSRAGALARNSGIQVVLLVLMVIAATGMARGFGMMNLP